MNEEKLDCDLDVMDTTGLQSLEEVSVQHQGGHMALGQITLRLDKIILDKIRLD